MARQERAIRTRQSILTAAAEVFDEVGYEGATISEILQRSGVTKGALYFHFSSKDDLVQGVLEGQIAAMPEVPPHELKLQEAVDRGLMLAHLLRHEPLLRGSVRLAVEQGSTKEGLHPRMPYQAWLDVSLRLFEDAKAAGELLPHIDATRTAQVFVGSFTGVQLMSQALSGREDVEARMADLYSYLMSAIAVPGVLVRLDIQPDRGERVHKEAVRLNEEQRERQPEQAGTTA
ncbi:ScbR family autoregulator-binding transcription factor [Streptomyces albus]|uniref:ScbR family autoregulator-binding transcription factor n=1 Tax=Streptomyces albus TaxID=1888 RepID=UPI0033F2347E